MKTAFVIWTLVVMAVWAAFVYVAVHFILKHW